MIFTFRDTHGLTIPTILAVAEERGISRESQTGGLAEYEKLMQGQQERSRAASKMTGAVFADVDLDLNGLAKTEFCGYEAIRSQGKILRLFVNNQPAPRAEAGNEVKVVLDKTPFYAESGGQVGDTGLITGSHGRMEVTDTVKMGDIFVHLGRVLEGRINKDESVTAGVDEKRRLSIMRNHTATHLLQAALRKVLGMHVQQQGSVVDADRLRFDFTHPKGLTQEEIRSIEQEVYQSILDNRPVTRKVLSLDEAKKSGALAFFEEKYGETVSVISIEDVSREFCGGTHLNATGQIGLFKIVSESAIAQGIRRLEAKTGWGAFDLARQNEDRLYKTAQLMKAPVEEIDERLAVQLRKVKQLEKELEAYRFESAKNEIDAIIQNAETRGGRHKIITHIYAAMEIGLLRKISDFIKQKAKSAVIILGSRSSDTGFVLIAVTDDLVNKEIKANDLVAAIAPVIHGSGGGRPQLAQAGGGEPTRLEEAIRQAAQLAKEKLPSY